MFGKNLSEYFINFNIKQKSKFFIPMVVLFLYFIPFFLMNERSSLPIIDNLDSNFVWEIILLRSNALFGAIDSIVPSVMGGIPRNCFPSEWNLVHIFFFVFEPYLAYLCNLILIHVIAFFGMYFLLSRHFIKEDLISIGVALAFALLPFWPFGYLSIAGLPFALYSFLNFRKGEYSFVDWIILALIPFYSWFVYSYIFLLALMICVWLYDAIRKKSKSVFLQSIIFMLLMFLFVEYRLIYSLFFDNSFVSHRSEFNVPAIIFPSIENSLSSGIELFLFGQFNSYSFQWVTIILSLIISLIIIYRKKLFKGNLNLFVFVSFVLISSFFYGFYYMLPMPNISGFQFNRLMWLNPLFWHLIYAISLAIIFHANKYGKIIVILLIGIQIGCLFCYCGDENTQAGGYGLIQNQRMNFHDFFSVELFSEVKESIGKPVDSYRIVCIGFHPAIAQYNGFYTAGSYQINYPLNYKDKFRTLIENELNKKMEIKNYFDNWGSRCYLFTSQTAIKSYSMKHGMQISPNLNSSAYQPLEIKYILSSVEIENPVENNIEFIGIFENSRSPWKIWVYATIV
ncbi:DUF6044 family protein [Methanocalculus sp.]|uniref:DUF6044 family protein n=1 Tax=Methanocalculus sp. TaxID=2004547 RepID=UPI0026343122|nr:DUF6044 family protein [Methanocalculus sp.]MDG6249247.1 DUF6044 family protein [Methanocalculus sp.]